MSLNIKSNFSVKQSVAQPRPPATVTPYSVYFNGTTANTTVPYNTAFVFGTGDFTVEAFVKFESLRTDAKANIIDIVKLGDGGNASGPVTTTWNFVYDNQSKQMAFYRYDGSTIVTGFNFTAINASNPVRMALGYYGPEATFTGPRYMNGWMNNLRIVKGTAVYTGNFTKPNTNLSAISGTSLLTFQNSTFVDNSANNFTVTAVGSAVIQQTEPF